MDRTQHATPLRIGMVGTYPPKACGLAAYAADLNAALLDNGHQTIVVASVNDEVAAPDTITLSRDDPDSYRAVARQLASHVDVVLIHHEFGIYGGNAGSMLHELTDNLTVPFAITLHTVTPHYTDNERTALEPVLARAAQIQVFTGGARTLLVNQQLALTDVGSSLTAFPPRSPHACPSRRAKHDSGSLHRRR